MVLRPTAGSNSGCPCPSFEPGGPALLSGELGIWPSNSESGLRAGTCVLPSIGDRVGRQSGSSLFPEPAIRISSCRRSESTTIFELNRLQGIEMPWTCPKNLASRTVLRESARACELGQGVFRSMYAIIEDGSHQFRVREGGSNPRRSAAMASWVDEPRLSESFVDHWRRRDSNDRASDCGWCTRNRQDSQPVSGQEDHHPEVPTA